MSDDPQDFQLSDQTDDTSSEKAPMDQPEHAQPAEPQAAAEEESAEPGEQAVPAAYAADLRQTLVREDDQSPEETRTGWFKRLTRRLTRPQGKTTPPVSVGVPPAALPTIPPALETPAAAEEPVAPEESAAVEALSAPDDWPAGAFDAETEAGETIPGAAGETDWMSEIRHETSQPDVAQEPAGESSEGEEQRGRDSLREFLSGLLRGQDAQDKPDETPEISDDLVAGRLGRSLGASPQDQPPEDQAELGTPDAAPLVFDESHAPLFDVTSPFAAEPLPADVDLNEVFPEMGSSADEEASLLENQEARFSPSDESIQPEEGEGTSFVGGTGEPGTFTLSPEEEAQVWGENTQPEVAQPAEPAPENFEAAPPGEEVPDLSRLTQDKPTTSPVSAADAFAAAYLTGGAYVPPEEVPLSPDYLLQQALDRAHSEESSISNEDLRAIALEGYQDTQESQPAATSLEVEPVASAPSAAAPEPAVVQPQPRNFKSWFAARSLIEKILLIEALIVTLVIVAAIPFFVNAILHANARPAVTSGITPRPLPGNLPYPVGVTLPGGWYFPLAKSTFVGGKWQPTTSEWLEGTEVRRVLAVPWNPQTEAVVRSFHPGDVIHVLLSNQEVADYKVVSIDRVPVTDTSVLTDQSPSLAIILYQENATQRWVILGKP